MIDPAPIHSQKCTPAAEDLAHRPIIISAVAERWARYQSDRTDHHHSRAPLCFGVPVPVPVPVQAAAIDTLFSAQRGRAEQSKGETVNASGITQIKFKISAVQSSPVLSSGSASALQLTAHCHSLV